MKAIEYSRHARRRMQERGVLEKEVEIVMQEPEYVELSVKERKMHISL